MQEPQELIDRLIKEKSILKQDVFSSTVETFQDLKEVLKEVIDETNQRFGDADGRIEIYYRDRGDFQAEIKIAGDIIIFQMHSNVFQFDNEHPLWKSGYLKDHPENSYIGMISIYNFLADSFRYQRQMDIGYMIGRIFVNKDRHFMLQGKNQLGIMFNDFINSKLDKENLKKLIQTTIIYTLNFDLLIPPYEHTQAVTVDQIQTISNSQTLATGKRLGFQFGLDEKAD
ncbi:MAG: hypothetical protein R2809_11320 [Flavobacteriales bacterium]